jgi:hypothetical protein
MKRSQSTGDRPSARAKSGTRTLSARAVLLLMLCGVMAIALPIARGQERNFAGSVQGSYLYAQDEDGKPARARALDGFTTEMSAKLAVDFGEHVSTAVKMCFGCHGFEVGMAFVDMNVVDELRFRVGRFTPNFGEFNLRHDPANHRTVDKPLPYDMGRMIRGQDWNWGVLPSPLVDNGVEVSGTHWFGYTFQLDYSAYAISGLRGDNTGTDVNFVQTRTPYYVDNNSRPAGGGRVSGTLDFADQEMSFTFGLSGMYGKYDPDNNLSYMIGGVDGYARVKKLELRAEYLLRRTEMDLGDDPASRFKYGPGKDGKYDRYFLKDGFYVEALYPVIPRVELVGRFDGLRRNGNVVTTSALREKSAVFRYTLGTDITVGHGVRVKVAAEYYDFSDFQDEVCATVGVVAVL